jgi:hypothetical protein
MTPLRKHIFAARDAHRGATYPGDLAADVMGDARVGPGRGAAILARTGIAALAAAAAVAAAIAMFVSLRSPDVPTQLSANVAPGTAPASERIDAAVTPAELAQARAGTSSMFSPPSMSSFVPSAAAGSLGTAVSTTTDVPSFPSLTALLEEAGSLSDQQRQWQRQQFEDQPSLPSTETRNPQEPA